MQQPCSRCGYISDRPARFCRQCGSQLFDETDVTSATTKNMAQQPPQFADQQSAGHTPGYSPGSYAQGSYAPGGWAEQTPGTAPFYQAPVAAQYRQPAVEQEKNFNWGKWILLSFLTILLFTVIVGGALFFWGKRVAERALERVAAENPGSVVFDQRIPEIPVPGGVPVSEGQAVTLESLKYPGAKVIESVIAPFAETIRMTTDDDLETVKQYYDKKFAETYKNLPTNIQRQDDEKYGYTILSHPLINIEIEPDDSEDGKTRISIAKVSAPIPNLEKLKELQRN
ncbi:MAG: zinc ribbon domain-containing protein [Acidobacteriota bacterium]